MTPKQKRFVEEYIVDLNGTKAALRAGYSERTARAIAAENLTKPDITKAIQRAMEERSKKTGITAERVLQEIAKIAFFDPRKLFESDGSAKHILDLDDVSAAAVAGLEVCELFDGTGDQKHVYGLVKKIKLADKLGALGLLGKHLKLFTDKTEITGEGGGPVVFKLVRIGDREKVDSVNHD